MKKDLAKGKLVKVIAIWDNEDGTMTTFTGTGLGLNMEVENSPSCVESYGAYILYGPDTIKSVRIDTELIADEDTGRYGKFQREEIPEF